MTPTGTVTGGTRAERKERTRKLGLRIKAAREARKMSQKYLASKVFPGQDPEVARRSIMRYESGKHAPSAEVLASIARETKTSVSDLLGHEAPEGDDDDGESDPMTFTFTVPDTLLDRAIDARLRARGIVLEVAEVES